MVTKQGLCDSAFPSLRDQEAKRELNVFIHDLTRASSLQLLIFFMPPQLWQPVPLLGPCSPFNHNSHFPKYLVVVTV